jgi:hypothetical protein
MIKELIAREMRHGYTPVSKEGIFKKVILTMNEKYKNSLDPFT